MSTAEGFEEFVTIVDSGSLTAAAEALNLARPTLGRRLNRLEERLGVRLLHRTTRRLELTPLGERLYARAAPLVRAAREAESEVSRLDGVPRGLLRVSLPSEMPSALLGSWLVEFLRTHPEVELEVVASGGRLDPVAERFDVALALGPVPDPTLVVKNLIRQQRIAVASPEYLATHGTPAAPEDLADHVVVRLYDNQGAPERTWPLLDGGKVAVAGPLAVNQMGLCIEAARSGLGIALASAYVVRSALDAGELVWVLPDTVGRVDRVALVYPDRAFLLPKVRAFVDFLAARMLGAHASAGAHSSG